MPVDSPLGGWVVAELSTGIAGGYCAKMLADGGADVIKVEPPDGDPLRRWSASGATIADGEDGALFQFLAGSKQSVVTDDLDEILQNADAVVWSPGSPRTPHEMLAAHPHLTVTAVTPWGLEGPWADRPATEFTLQAWSGAVIGLGRGDPAQAPAFVGGQIGEWLAGAYAAVGTMASQRQGGAQIVDVSVLEALCMCLTYYPVTYFDALHRPFRPKRSVMTPGVGEAKDGMIAVGVGTGQQWLDFGVMVGHPEWADDKSLFRERSHLAPVIDAWMAQHTVADIRDLATAFRLPNSPIANGENAPGLDHFEARGTFLTHPRGGFLRPGLPYRMQPAQLRPPGPAPKLGEHTGARRRERAATTEATFPFEGLRVLDMTAFWAGPSCTHLLAMLGADVIHVEATSRVDGTRMLGAPMTEPQWWERSPIFSAINTNKRSLALDFRSDAGMAVLRRLIASVDVIVENYTPRVLDQAGLTFDDVKAIRSDVIMVRMPGFGLDGPWRDHAAFAYTIEDAAGFTWLTGHPDQKPLEPYCVGDPNAGIHALAGLLLALAHRDRTGEGVSVEAAMVDAAVNVAAEQVIEFSAYGALLSRAGNRGPTAAPQGLYRTADEDERGGNDSWAAIAVATDAQWAALVGALGSPEWAIDPTLASMAGRVAAHDLIDARLSDWCAVRTGDEVVADLWPLGIPVAKVVQPHRQGEVTQLATRGFFETVTHPVLGEARHSTMPMRFSRRDRPMHRRHAPLLGEHNADVLGSIGLTDDEIAALEADGVIGCEPAKVG